MQVLNDFTQAEKHRHGAELLESGKPLYFYTLNWDFLCQGILEYSIRIIVPLTGENVMEEKGEDHAAGAMTLPKTYSVSRFLLVLHRKYWIYQ